MEAGERPNQAVHRLAKSTSKASGSSRGRARVRELVVDLPPHAVHLLMHGFGDVAGTGRGCPVGFVCDDRKRRLQAVREITGPGDGARDRPIALVEQRVEVVNQRLHLGRVRAFQSMRAAGVQCSEVTPDGIDGRQTASHLEESAEHERARHNDRQVARERAVDTTRSARMHGHHAGQRNARQNEQADGPERRADEQARAKREMGLHGAI